MPLPKNPECVNWVCVIRFVSGSDKKDGAFFSSHVSDDRHSPLRLVQFSNPNRTPAEEIFNHAGFVIAIFEPDNFRRSASLLYKSEEVRIGCHDHKSVGSGKLPNRFVRCEPGKS